MDLREKVARGLCIGHWFGMPEGPEFNALIDHDWKRFEDDADAAIRTVLDALREPSGMATGCGQRACDYDLYSHQAKAVWQAMLDAAIREHAGDADLIDGGE